MWVRESRWKIKQPKQRDLLWRREKNDLSAYSSPSIHAHTHIQCSHHFGVLFAFSLVQKKFLEISVLFWQWRMLGPRGTYLSPAILIGSFPWDPRAIQFCPLLPNAVLYLTEVFLKSLWWPGFRSWNWDQSPVVFNSYESKNEQPAFLWK